METPGITPEVYWDTRPNKQPQTQLIATGFIGTDRLVQSLEESEIDLDSKEATKKALKQGWSNIAYLLHEGGIVTSEGVIVQGIPDPIRKSPELQKFLATEFIAGGTAGNLRKRFKLRPESLGADPRRHIYLLNSRLDKKLFYTFKSWTNRRNQNVIYPAFYVMDNDGMGREFWPSFTDHFRLLFRNSNLPEIVSAESASQQALFDISHNFGLGRRDDIEIKPVVNWIPITPS